VEGIDGKLIAIKYLNYLRAADMMINNFGPFPRNFN
jgi:hypothetical protein